LCELACYTTENRRSDQVFMATGLAANEAVEEAVLEAGEEGRGQATTGEEGMGSGFS
jgi:5,10-methenyltetrahydromethanopterin hydrogenase